MTVLSRGARVRRGGRRPGWVLLTALLVLAMGASSALVFTNRVELLKLAVILALWAAVAGAFVSVLYRRQSDADQSKVRDLKLVYDLQLDREISARREYELTVESQLRRELAAELRAQAADEVAALRAELAALRANLEILFDTDLADRRALENSRADWARSGGSAPADWVSSDRLSDVPPENALERTDESPIIDVSEVRVPPAGATPPRQPAPPREPPPYQPPPPAPEPAPQTQPESPHWQPTSADGRWLPAGAPGSNWSGVDEPDAPDPLTGRRRARHSSPEVTEGGPFGESGRRAHSRHSTEHPDDDGETPPPRLAPAPPPEPAPRHRSIDDESGESGGRRSRSGGQSVADLLARLQVEPTGGGRRRRRDG
ncbi:DUF6779 domain-containing protein [Mycobacterium conspicuum]|jgi:hypothetical protein|uniref:Membrane protein n=1 Tax=Mycobacterium conspicuum TaxID=44010 RepID=A0A1X1SYL3_9MYCO|nr:DUF6779 domain-containing protein [Mycobacterium conspicuum]ORV36661.1 hypothetical protein AWC00_24215 [Mycobacterium conspicuum]BBZ41891.1 membrane protein [Mycobacterium conspicuum]